MVWVLKSSWHVLRLFCSGATTTVSYFSYLKISCLIFSIWLRDDAATGLSRCFSSMLKSRIYLLWVWLMLCSNRLFFIRDSIFWSYSEARLDKKMNWGNIISFWFKFWFKTITFDLLNKKFRFIWIFMVLKTKRKKKKIAQI